MEALSAPAAARVDAPDFAAMAHDLASGAPPERTRPWLEESWSGGLRFWRALEGELARRGPPSKSRRSAGADLFHDLVVRHAGSGRDAVVERSPSGGWARLGYADLSRRAAALCSEWREAGVAAGERLAILLPPGIDLAVAMLAALRLGAALSVLPPRGRTWVQNRLSGLGVERVASLPRYRALLGEDHRLLPVTPRATYLQPEPDSHTYRPDDLVLRSIAPFSDDPAEVVELSADRLLSCLLRDGLLILQLGPGARFGLPGLDPLAYQPWATLVALFAGATFVELSELAYASAEGRAEAALEVLGVSLPVREAISGEGPPQGLRRWFRSPAELYDWAAWERFSRALGSEDRPRGANLLVSAAAGGVLAFSSWQGRLEQLGALPAPGTAWRLADMVGSESPGVADAGLFVPEGEGLGAGAHGRFLFARWGAGLQYGGSLDTLVRGRVYPAREVEAVAAALPGVIGAAALAFSGVEMLHKARVCLVVFVAPGAARPRELEQELREHLARELGSEALPDELRSYPLWPRLEDGRVDRAWCRWQLQSGLLAQKAKDPAFRLLSRARHLAAELGRAEGGA